MKQKNTLQFTTSVLLYPILFALTIWLVFWFELRFQVRFNKFGIYPGTFEGLRGIVFSPFIHGSLKHLFNNTVPLLVLSMALFYFYRNISWKVLFYGMLLTGLLTWLIGRPAIHIGASGVIYMLVAFLFLKGILSKHIRLIALSLIVVFLYGGLWWYVMPIEQGISWEGHLSGFIVGGVFAFIFKSNVAKPLKYHWEQKSYTPDNDPFMKAFDDDGNFVGYYPEAETTDTSLHETEADKKRTQSRIRYTFKPADKEKE